MHLADAFIQSDLQCIQNIHLLSACVFLGIEPTTFALLTQCSTTEPQEYYTIFYYKDRSPEFESRLDEDHHAPVLSHFASCLLSTVVS